MDKKKLLIKIFLIIFIIALIIGVILILTNKKDKPTNVISKPLNENIKLENVFDKIERIEEIEDTNDYIKEAEEIDFKEYNVLEKGAIVNTTEELVDEIWLIKLGSLQQQEEVCRILGTRVQKLKNAFENNKEQMNILNNAVIKQEDGIIIMILSSDAKQIEETIANEMKK